MGTLERLQRAVFEYLSGISDLKYADILMECSREKSYGGKAEGLSATVTIPIPVKASKYAAGPTFSEANFGVKIVRDDSIAVRAPSLLTSCEIVSRALHNWTAPISSGYGKIQLCRDSPWIRENSLSGVSAIIVNFSVQSVLS